MIYSESKDFLFIAIDKTGSTSVQTLLAPYAHSHKHLRYLRKRLRFTGPLTRCLGIYRQMIFPVHATAAQLQCHFPRKRWNALFKFCFVRHPLDRITSRYEFLRREERLPNSTTFSEYLDSILSGQRGFFHQHQYILDRHSKPLVDWWGKLESIQDDFNTLAQRLKITAQTPPHLNSSKQQEMHYLDYYSPSQRTAAENFTKTDINLFNYSQS